MVPHVSSGRETRSGAVAGVAGNGHNAVASDRQTLVDVIERDLVDPIDVTRHGYSGKRRNQSAVAHLITGSTRTGCTSYARYVYPNVPLAGTPNRVRSPSA